MGEVGSVSSEKEQATEQLRQRLVGLRGRDLTDEQVAAEVRHILAMGEPAIPILLDQFMGEDETLLAVATQALKAWGEPRPVKPLLDLLRNSNVSDLAKALILTILETYGLEVDASELLGLGINLEEYRLDSTGNGDDETPDS
jgi:hypothetical protein